MHAPHDEEPEPTPGFNRKYSDRSLGYFELDHPLLAELDALAKAQHLARSISPNRHTTFMQVPLSSPKMTPGCPKLAPERT